MNLVGIIGNATRDPQMKYTASGMAICEIGVAINEKKKQGNDWVDATVFVDVTLFGKTAETAGEYVRKGQKVGVTGKLALDQWDDKATGQKRSKLKVVGERIDFMGSRSQDEQPPKPQPSPQPSAGTVPDDDSIPF